MNDDEEKMLDDAEKREQDAILVALSRYRPAVLAYVRRRGFTPDEAQDLTQKVFARVCQSVKDYRGDAAAAYLLMIAKNLVANELRDRSAQKRTGFEVPIEGMLGLPARDLPADVAFEKKELSDRLRLAVAQLELPLRACVISYLEGKSHQEIAKTHGLTVSAVKSRLHTARERLRELMGVDFRRMGGES